MRLTQFAPQSIIWAGTTRGGVDQMRTEGWGLVKCGQKEGIGNGVFFVDDPKSVMIRLIKIIKSMR